MKKTVRRAAGLFFSVWMAAACMVNVSAEGKQPLVTYDSGTGYIAEKITHPERDVMTTDGIVDYTGNGTLAANLEDGAGDRGRIIHGVPSAMGIACISAPATGHGLPRCSL